MSRLFHDPSLGGLHALGVDDVELLFDPDAAPAPRAEELERDGSHARLRFPLPGTPETPDGPLTDAPRGAGTGWVVLDRFTRTPWRELVRARLTQPRSASLAERNWNVLCHLRAHGVGTPEPLAVGARGRDSFLVTRALEDFRPIPQWLAEETLADSRKRGLFALGHALGRLFAACVHLPHLAPAHLHISNVEPGFGCDWRAQLLEGGLRRNRLPSVVLAEVEGAVLRERPQASDVATMLARVDVPMIAGVASERERMRVVHVALANLDRDLRRAVWRTLLG